MSTSRESKTPQLMSFMTLRRVVGLLGILLPVVLVIGTVVINQCQCTSIQASISHYYYTATRDVFVGVLWAVGLFLITYKGYDFTDHIVTNIAGIAAMLVSLLPTSDNLDKACRTGLYIDNPLREALHYTSAGLFFAALAYMSTFQFTQSRGRKTKRKRQRNRLYVACAIVIVLCCLAIGVIGLSVTDINCIGPAVSNTPKESFWVNIKQYSPTFWLETFALWAFGLSWLTKGEFLLADTEEEKANAGTTLTAEG